MRLAVALGGTDQGRSGLGSYVRAIVPRLASRLAAAGGGLIAMGTAADLAAYGPEVRGLELAYVPSAFDRPAASAAWHLVGAGDRARRAGADVLLLAAANRRATFRSPIPTVAVVHDLAQLHVRGKYDPLRMAYLRYAVLAALRSARRLVAVSGATKKDLAAALAIAPERVRVVPNGVEHTRFVPMEPDDPRVVRARAATGLAGPYVLYPSRLEHPGKNHLRLLRAFAQSPARETHVLALAGGDWGAGAMIDDEARRLGLGARLAMLGYVADEHMPALLAGADVVAMVGLAEGFGLPALEALAAGRAVLAADAGALPEVVGPLGALCDPLDERAIAAALERAIGDVALRERAAREGPAWAAARGWDATADGLLAACHEAKES